MDRKLTKAEVEAFKRVRTFEVLPKAKNEEDNRMERDLVFNLLKLSEFYVLLTREEKEEVEDLCEAYALNGDGCLGYLSCYLHMKISKAIEPTDDQEEKNQ